jgi:hypothetical protein
VIAILSRFAALRSALVLVPALAGVAAPRAQADVLVTTTSKDATLFNDTVGNRANGGNFSFYAGRAGTNTSWPVRRGLVAFDLSSIPAGSTVTNVQLRLYMSQTVVGAKTFELKRVTKGWNEGTTVGFSGNGGVAVSGDVTWRHTFWNNQFWTTPGGDFVSAASASASVNAVGYYTWGSTATMVADVQGWVNNPATSHGWILIGPESAGGGKSAKQFEARESAAQFRPQLTVTYTPPPPPPVTIYCTAKVNSLGCTPSIGFSGAPDSNAGSGFLITATNVLNNKAGLLYYGTGGATALSFQGGFLCVKAPTLRTPSQVSGGTPSPANDCSGAYSIDFNTRIASGVDPALVSGASFWAQYWSRDPNGTFTTNLTNAVTGTIQP